MSRLMKNYSFTARLIVRALLCAGISVTAACSGDDGEPAGPAPKVEVPEIQGAVAAEDFCALSDEIRCAGNVGCCEDDGYASVDECLAYAACSDNVGTLLKSPHIADGTLVY